MYLLSICIPTYNRASHLKNCLSSLIQCGVSSYSEVQICVSDNCSTDATKQVVIEAQKNLSIKYRENRSNLGFARNVLEVVQIAEGKFVWMLGDDDLILPGACEDIIGLIKTHRLADYFYVNAYHLTTEFVNSFPQPFDLTNLPVSMEPFSARTVSGEIAFLKLINPNVSFDCLGGIFLSVFRRDMWLKHLGSLNKSAISDERIFSHFDNTFPHIRIFANAFSNSLAYFSAKPASVCLTGAREWAAMSPLIRSVRIIEAIDLYKTTGLSLPYYIYMKNSALNSFQTDMLKLIFGGDKVGGQYVDILKIYAKNSVYPNFYISAIYPFFKKMFWVRVKRFLWKLFVR